LGIFRGGFEYDFGGYVVLGCSGYGIVNAGRSTGIVSSIISKTY
jgi:hypothetical protein